MATGNFAGRSAGPLAGMRVIDLSVVVMGPYASQWLADFGAEVIKVEAPEGDSTRQTGPATEAGMSAVFLGVNRSKKSAVLDLKTASGREALLQLLATADVFMHSMRPQKLPALGLDPQTLRARFPRLVYASLHGFGEDGPYAGKPAYDDIIQGLSGGADLIARQSGEMRYFPTIAADKTSGLVAAMSIMAALLQRGSTGQGCQVEVPMFETMVAFNLVEHLYGRHFEPAQGPAGYPRVLAQWRRPYRTADSHVCMMPYTDAHWQRFFHAVEKPGLASDARFASMSARTANIAELYQVTGEIVATRPTAHWLDLCERIEIPASPVNTLDALPEDPHLHATNFFEQVPDETMGTVVYPAVPVRIDGQRMPISQAPRKGEHTLALLRAAGLPEERLQAMLAEGAIIDHTNKNEGTRA